MILRRTFDYDLVGPSFQEESSIPPLANPWERYADVPEEVYRRWRAAGDALYAAEEALEAYFKQAAGPR